MVWHDAATWNVWADVERELRDFIVAWLEPFATEDVDDLAPRFVSAVEAEATRLGIKVHSVELRRNHGTATKLFGPWHWQFSFPHKLAERWR